MACPHCGESFAALFNLVVALKKQDKALRIALANSRKNLEAQGPALKKAERAVKAAEEAVAQ